MFGDVLRRYRRRLGLTQEELAALAGVNVRSIGKLEAGQIAAPRPATVRLLADAFGLSGVDRDRFCEAAAPVEQSPAPPRPDRDATRPVPAQLPPDVPGFTGRADALRRLTTRLEAGHSEQPRTMLIVTIAGGAGVGKTALALHFAHRVRRQFADGQLYVNLRGFGPAGSAMNPAEALGGFLGALGIPPQRIPAEPAAQTALYRSLLTDRRMLVLLDNARDAQQVRPLLPGASGCLVLVTSRNQLPGLVAAEGAEPMTLDVLSRTESIRLLAYRLGEDRVRAEADAVEAIIERCAGLPLALAIVAARAATTPRLALAELSSTLRDTRDRWDAFAAGDAVTDVRAVFSWSYRALSPDAARLFRMFGLHPGVDLTVPVAASMAGLPASRARALMTELTGAHLMTEHISGRYTFHDLLRAYAAWLAETVDNDVDRREATLRLIDHYLHTAYAGALLLQARRSPIALDPPRPRTVPEPFAGVDEAMAWFTAEHAVLLAAVGHAARQGLDTRTWQLAWTLETFLSRRGYWRDWADSQTTALAAAQRCGDVAAQARAHRAIGDACVQLGLDQDALEHLHQAIELSGQIGDLDGEAHTNHNIARLHERRGAHDEVLRHSERALKLYEAAGHLLGQARSLNAIGWCHVLRGQYRPAIEYCTRALDVLRDSGDRRTEADIWDSLGYAHHRLGDHAAADSYYRRALDLFREFGDRYNEAVTLVRVGDNHQAAGEPGEPAWRQALTILDELSHADADEVRARLDHAGPG